MSDITEIDAEKLKRMLTLHVRFLLFDIRTQNEYMKDHIPTAINLEASEFLRKLHQMVPNKDIPLIVYDQDGTISRDAVRNAENQGYINVVGLEGGFITYKK